MVEDPLRTIDVTTQFNVVSKPAFTFGGVVLLVTITLAVFVHPFAASVAVTVNVPLVETDAGFAAFTNVPPFHTIVFPALTPVKVAFGVVQLMLLLLVAVIVGGVVLDVTVTESIDVHPFTLLVAVTVYVPALVTDAGFVTFTNVPPFHTMVLPALVPVNVALGVEQVILLLDAESVGGKVLPVIVTESIVVQPFVAAVTVRV